MVVSIYMKIKKPIIDVYRAWNGEGRNSQFHREMKDRLRVEWPVLAAALDNLDIRDV